MRKYEQLQKLASKKFHRWFRFVQTKQNIELFLNSELLLTVSYDDNFVIHNLYRFLDHSNMFIMQQCMPYGILTEKRVDGIYLNGTLWNKKDNCMIFDSDGDCLNPPEPSKHNRENRKTFNNYLLLWEKNVRIAAKMDAPRLDTLICPAYYSSTIAELTEFIQHPACTDIVEHCIHATYVSNDTINSEMDSKTRAIKAYRKHLDKAMYQNFLAGHYSFIGELKNE